MVPATTGTVVIVIPTNEAVALADTAKAALLAAVVMS
jgi:hypothetical protein